MTDRQVNQTCHVNVTGMNAKTRQISSNYLLFYEKFKLGLTQYIHQKPSTAGLQRFWSLK
jgi:hypothetical protein